MSIKISKNIRKKLRKLGCTILLTSSSMLMHAQMDTIRTPRVLFLLDGSASMVENWTTNQKRYNQASALITRLMDSLYQTNPELEFGLRVFGHEHGVLENNCYDTRREVRFSGDNRQQMKLRLQDIRPYGVSPIAFSLEEAVREDIVNLNKYYYSLVLITDGGESCGGDICKVYQNLISKKVFFKPYIVSLIDEPSITKQYECLGNILTTSNEQQFETSLERLIKDHRTIFTNVKATPSLATAPVPTVPKLTQTQIGFLSNHYWQNNRLPIKAADITSLDLRPVSSNVPKLNIPEPEFIKPASDAISFLNNRNTVQQLKMTNTNADNVALRKITLKYPLVNKQQFPEEAPVITRPAALTINNIQNRNFNSFSTTFVIASPKPKRVNLNFPLVKSSNFKEEPIFTKPATPEINSLTINRKTPYLPTIFGTVNPISIKVQKLNFPLVKASQFPEEPKPVVPPAKPATNKPTAKPTTQTTKTTEAKYDKAEEVSTETEMLVYFSDGRNKFYNTEPQLRIVNSITKEEVKKVYRTVDRRTGEPAPIKVPAGTYNIEVVNRANTAANKIEIKDGVRTKINIIVGQGSLKFNFNNSTKPMSEYQAVVYRRFAGNIAPVTQNAAEEKVYEPGTYYAEINTFPIHKAAFEIGFDETLVVQVPEAGSLKIANTNAVGNVGLYMVLGDDFVQFGNIVIEGNPEQQQIEIQPGVYQLRYIKGSGPTATKEILKIRIDSKKQTVITL